jgi:hypothetical protein
MVSRTPGSRTPESMDLGTSGSRDPGPQDPRSPDIHHERDTRRGLRMPLYIYYCRGLYIYDIHH